MRTLLPAVLTALAILGSAGCRPDGPTTPGFGTDSIVRVEVLPESFRLDWVSERHEDLYSVRLWTSETDTVPLGDRKIIWRSSDTRVVRIDSLGTIEGRDIGTATISATVSGVRGTATIHVGADDFGPVTGVFTYPMGRRAAPEDVMQFFYEVLRSRARFDFDVWTGEPADSVWSLNPTVLSAAPTNFNGIARVVTTAPGLGRVVVARDTKADTMEIVVIGALPPAPAMTSLNMNAGRSCGRTADARFFCWGRPVFDYAETMMQYGDRYFLPFDAPVGEPFTSISLAASYGCGLTAAGLASCWGQNASGTLGTGDLLDRSAPDTVRGGHRFTAISTADDHACGILPDLTAMCWGSGTFGALGTGNQASSTVPVPVVGGDRFIAMSSGASHTCALRDDRTVMCWGSGFAGQLGDGVRSPRLVPTFVTGLTDVVSLSAGAFHTCAVRSGGGAYCWGFNSRRELGDGTTGLRGEPVRVIGVPPLAQIAAGSAFTCGRSTVGEVFCWGMAHGYDLSATFSVDIDPFPIPGTHRFVEIDVGGTTACGRKADGSVWCWGDNELGEVGDGTNISRWKPREVRGN